MTTTKNKEKLNILITHLENGNDDAAKKVLHEVFVSKSLNRVSDMKKEVGALPKNK
jgi:hypothetical protein